MNTTFNKLLLAIITPFVIVLLGLICGYFWWTCLATWIAGIFVCKVEPKNPNNRSHMSYCLIAKVFWPITMFIMLGFLLRGDAVLKEIKQPEPVPKPKSKPKYRSIDDK